MKSFSILFFFLCVSYFSFSQSNTPKTQDLFKQKIDSLFPNATNLEWQKKGPRYEVDFVYNNHSVSMTFNKKGYVIKSIKEIDYNQLPMVIRKQIEKEYADYKLFFFLENDHKGQIDYEIEVMKGKKFFILDYSSDGELLSKNTIQKNDIYNLNTII